MRPTVQIKCQREGFSTLSMVLDGMEFPVEWGRFLMRTKKGESLSVVLVSSRRFIRSVLKLTRGLRFDLLFVLIFVYLEVTTCLMR